MVVGRKLELIWPHKEGRLLYRKNAKGITEPHFVGPCAIAPRPLIDVEQTGSERGKRWSPDSNLLIVGDTPNPTRGGWSDARLRCQWLSLLACRSPAHVVRANVPTRWSITRRSARIRPRSLRGQCAMGASQYQHPSGKDATPLCRGPDSSCCRGSPRRVRRRESGPWRSSPARGRDTRAPLRWDPVGRRQ